MWTAAEEQDQEGGGRGRGAQRGWEPTSPWSKDRPAVPLKNICEFEILNISKCVKLR